MTLSTPACKLLYVSPGWVGKTHDYRMSRSKIPPAQAWFERFRVRVALGFLGIEKDYVRKETLIPHKKPRLQDLTPEQKRENPVLASQRIVVEQAQAGLKRYRILSDPSAYARLGVIRCHFRRLRRPLGFLPKCLILNVTTSLLYTTWKVSRETK